ncbi:pyridoxal phosphate-dependent aminotransferase [Portibacter lacus]|uniref:alanine transaminase n=1 Tax=Portibacter lacus TaxID=1099794 RepID=A0AA37SLI3_9BACT|nr:pyridoxal phosphate-dependent aminotransferase [Portibacter lacus]GLR16322.1 aminotransferase [Portibacter lacus]
MRQNLISPGATELQYEIREIVKKAEKLEKLGMKIFQENIGDPIAKNHKMPQWIKDILKGLMDQDETYGYCHSKGVLETREYLASKTNARKGAQITAEDIIFFNGLGDAISKVYQFLLPTSRVIGPSPAYSTHSSAEAAHANHQPVTYFLDPDNGWLPDLEDLYLKVKYNPNIVGILIINPDNPTGMVYPEDILERMIGIAREFDLFILADEIYLNILYNGAETKSIAELIGDVPAISMKGISKEIPWPGSRCGWTEFYNRDKDPAFSRLCKALEDAKMIEVCSTKLPQMAIPMIMEHPNYKAYRKDVNQRIGERSKIISGLLSNIDGIRFNPTFGAFYNTIIFEDNVLNRNQKMKIKDEKVQSLLDSWIDESMSLDKRFVYYLLAAKGICVVPVSSFCSELLGFRVTLLEENEETLRYIFKEIKEGIEEYLNS